MRSPGASAPRSELQRQTHLRLGASQIPGPPLAQAPTGIVWRNRQTRYERKFCETAELAQAPDGIVARNRRTRFAKPLNRFAKPPKSTARRRGETTSSRTEKPSMPRKSAGKSEAAPPQISIYASRNAPPVAKMQIIAEPTGSDPRPLFFLALARPRQRLETGPPMADAGAPQSPRRAVSRNGRTRLLRTEVDGRNAKYSARPQKLKLQHEATPCPPMRSDRPRQQGSQAKSSAARGSRAAWLRYADPQPR